MRTEHRHFLQLQYLAAEEVSGEIRVLRELDYERRTSYRLIAVPVENRSHGEAIHVVVNIIDENDNTPTFPASSIDVSSLTLNKCS